MSQNISFQHNPGNHRWEANLSGQACTIRIDFTHAEWVEASVCHANMLPQNIYANSAQTHRFDVETSPNETILISCYSEPVGGVVMDPTATASATYIQQVENLQSSVDQMMGTNDTTPEIDSMKEVKDFLAGTNNTQNIGDILPSEMTDEEAAEIKNMIK